MTTELLDELETTIKRFRVAPDQAAELQPDSKAEEVTVCWQRATGRAPTVQVTVPVGEERWAVPVPHRPDWLTDLIVKNAPDWWLK
jgi:hypothetical protein